MSKKTSVETENTETETVIEESTEKSEVSDAQVVDTAATAAAVTTESEQPTANQTSSATETAVSSGTKQKRYGLTRYLQLHPQSTYIVALLKPYAMSVMTESEWEATIKEILGRKVKY